MVSGINFSNYSVEQLKELKNNGVNVSDEAIKAAEEKEAQAKTDKSTDEANIKYEISDEEASKTNEAKKEVETAAEYGANLKTILKTLMDKCNSKASEMQDLSKELDDFTTQIDTLTSKADGELIKASGYAKELSDKQTESNEISENAIKMTVEKEKEIEEKQKEIDEVTDKINTAIKNGEPISDEDKTKEQTLRGDLTKLNNELNELKERRDKELHTFKDLTTNLKDKFDSSKDELKVTSEQAEEIVGKANAAAVQAQNANEYADVTIEKGTEASNITDKGAAKSAGFTKRSGFLGLRKKGDVVGANRMGNGAIAIGADLGNKTQNVIKNVKDLASTSGVTVSKESNINNLESKLYANTDNFKDEKTGKYKYNPKTIASIAEQQKKFASIKPVNIGEQENSGQNA